MAPRPQPLMSQELAWPAPFYEPEIATVGQRVALLLPATGPSLLVRTIWYLAVGWWLVGLVVAFAYALALTVVGIPLALLILSLISSCRADAAPRPAVGWCFGCDDSRWT